jgi:phosphopantetheine--protein transferase-like protein
MSHSKKVTPSVGIDIVEVARFTSLIKEKKGYALKKIFFDQEIAYAFSRKDPAIHLAGMFAAKEAVSKACGVTKYPYIMVEIFHTGDGAPYACYKGKKIAVAVSISHTATIATAIAIR